MKVSVQLHDPGRLTSEQSVSLPVGAWVTPRVGLDALERMEKCFFCPELNYDFSVVLPVTQPNLT